jgi:hypothetical protein
MHWWGEGMSGIANAFIRAYACLDKATCKHNYKHYATGALLNWVMSPFLYASSHLNTNIPFGVFCATLPWSWRG